MPAPILRTKRLYLRHWREEDLPVFAKLNSDPKVMEFFPSKLTNEESNHLAKRIENELNEKDYGMWAVELPNIASFIGFIGLHYPGFTEHFTPCIEIGWRLDCNYWGHGYAIEGAREVLRYGFMVLKLKEVVAFAPQIHNRSRRIMKKLDMKFDLNENFIHPKIPKESNLNPFVLYRITKSEYDAININGSDK